MENIKQIKVNEELHDIEDSKARSDITSEITNRTNADDALQEKINTNKTGIDNLVNDVAVRNVKAEEVTNVPEVKLPLDEVKEEIEAAGNRVLNSIPDDYIQINNDISELKGDLAYVLESHKNINYGYGTMPVTYSGTTAMWSVPYTNSNNKKFTVKIGIKIIDGFNGTFAIRLQARKAGNAHIAQIDSFIPNDVSQNDIILHYDFGDTDFTEISNFNISAIFVSSGSLTVNYFGLFEGELNDCSTYTENAEKMYVYTSYDKEEIDDKLATLEMASKEYTDSKFDTVASSNKNNGTEKPLFDLFGDYGNRDVKIVMVGDSTTDGIEGAGAGLYATFKLYQCSGELLEGAVIVDKGANGSMASGYANGYESKTGKLYEAVQENGDLYIVSFGLNDIRDTDITSQIIADRLSYIVDTILRDTKGKVILRVPNPFREDYNAVPSMTAQECTDTIYEAYMLIKNKWAKDKVRMLDMQELIFGKNALPLDSTILMNDNTHPRGRTNASWYNRDEFGLNKVARAIAEAIGRKPIMTETEYRKLVFDGEENDFQNHPMLLDYNSDKYQLIKDELTFGGMGSNYLDIWNITSSELSTYLSKGCIIKLGNKSAFIFNGNINKGTSDGNTRLGGQTYPIVCARDEVATVSIYREIS